MSRPRRGARAGFSLVELVIAMLLSSFVMIGIVGISAQMVRFQVEGMKKGSVTGWSLVAITAMNKEIEDATVLVYPMTGVPQDSLSICKNYSNIMNNGAGGALDAAGPIENVAYCYDSTPPGYLRRDATTGSCPALGTAPPACGTFSDIVATGVYRDESGSDVFRRADEVGGVQIRYRIGNPTPTTNMPMPQTMAFDMKFAMNKQYNNTFD